MYMIYQQYTTAIKEGYADRPQADIAQQAVELSLYQLPTQRVGQPLPGDNRYTRYLHSIYPG